MEGPVTSFADRPWFQRLLQTFPGGITWLFIIGPVVLSLVAPLAIAYLVIAFDLFWLVKSFRLAYYLIRGYRKMRAVEKVNWNERLDEIENLDDTIAKIERQIEYLLQHYPRAGKHFPGDPKSVAARLQYMKLRQRLEEFALLKAKEATLIHPKDLYNAVIIATYNESRDILEPSVVALTESEYPTKQMMLIIAYEERGGEETALNAQALVEQYGHHFAYAVAIAHPDGIAGEVRGKGGNITYAGRKLTEYIAEQEIDPERVIVTTLDSDHRASSQYFAHLSYEYAIDVNRTRRSYQPVALFYNNLWDVPAPMRVLAFGNSFWVLIESMRPHRLRNFAAHAQSLQALIDTDYWSVSTIVEDGHQYWRTYFTYDGDHHVVPLFSPVFQDAVLAEGYLRTFQMQYLQIRRWAWGVSDFPYVVTQSIKNKRISWNDKAIQIWRLFEGHFSWATAPLVITFAASLPIYFNRAYTQHNLLAYQLPVLASYMMTIASVGLLATILVSLISLPPKPKRYTHRRSIMMVAQWVLLPVTSILFSALAAIDAQTRLMLNRPLGFVVTEKFRRDNFIVEEIDERS